MTCERELESLDPALHDVPPRMDANGCGCLNNPISAKDGRRPSLAERILRCFGREEDAET